MPSEEQYKQISKWLDLYHSSDNKEQKSKYKALITTIMIPVVKKIAKTIARRAYDPIEDLTQAGCLGLLKAIDNYSKEKNDNFRVYAGYLIIGEIKHYIRDKSNVIRVPRHIQELVIRINTFTQTLTNDEVQKLTSDDVASALNIPTKTIDFALQADRRCSTISLEDVYQGDDYSLGYEELISDGKYEEKSEIEDIKILFDKYINFLPSEEKVVIDMYYKQDMSQKEIAEALQLTQMSVSRKIKKAFSLISQYSGGSKDLFLEDSIKKEVL